MDPVNEAATILTRLFESLARLNHKTLNVRSRADITRACELLSHAGEDLSDLLDELPPRPAREYATQVLPEVERWREQRGR
jgi:hypothetical protein